MFGWFFSCSYPLDAGKQHAQDWVRTGTNLGAARIRLAAANFNPSSADPQTGALKTTFDTTLFNDLSNAGIFDMVSKSMAPPLMPANPQQMKPAGLVRGAVERRLCGLRLDCGDQGRAVAVYGWLFDAKNPDAPQILGKQYNEAASQDSARLIAHRFADEIITRLGGGISGIAETHIYYICCARRKQRSLADGLRRAGRPRSPTWARFRFRRAVRLTTIALPLLRWASRGGRSACIRWCWAAWSASLPWSAIRLSPAWSSDGAKLAFSASRSGDPEIYTSDASGGQREAGDDVSRT